MISDTLVMWSFLLIFLLGIFGYMFYANWKM